MRSWEEPARQFLVEDRHCHDIIYWSWPGEGSPDWFKEESALR